MDELSPASAGLFRAGMPQPSHARLSNHCSRWPFSGLHSRGPALTTNLTKALFFEKKARKTQNKARRERLLRAARRYLLAAAKDLEPPPRIK